jgi:hypothetical protein
MVYFATAFLEKLLYLFYQTLKTMLTKSHIHTVHSDAKNYENTSVVPHYFSLFVQPRKPEQDLIIKEDPLPSTQKMKVVYHILQLVVVLVFIGSGMLLWIADVPVYLFSFQSGIPVPFIHAVSIIATLLALIQLFPVTSFAAHLGLTLISLAAVGVHLILGSPLYSLLPAFLLLILILLAICLNYKLASPDTSHYQSFK